MSDPLTPDDPQVTTQPLQLIQTAYEQLGADTCLPNVYHAVVCTQKSLQYEWRRILQGADEVCTGTDTWPSGEPIQYCYFLPGGRTDAFQKSPLDQAKMEAANKVVTRVGELGEKALALVNALGIVKGNVTGLFPRENWLYLLYSFSWKYPGLGLSAERYRIFRPSKDSPFKSGICVVSWLSAEPM
jgi:hypothetical protein